VALEMKERTMPRKGDTPAGSRIERRLLVEFGPGILDEIREMAVYKDQPVTVMVRGWIVERLREEQRRMYRPGGEQ